MLVHHANYFSNKILLKLFGLRVGIYTNKSDSQKLSLIILLRCKIVMTLLHKDDTF